MDRACDLVKLPWIYRKAVAYLNTLLVSTCSGDLAQKAHALARLSMSECALTRSTHFQHCCSSLLSSRAKP